MKKLLLVIVFIIGISTTIFAEDNKKYIYTNREASFDLMEGMDFYNIYELLRLQDSSDCEIIKTNENNIILMLDNNYYLINKDIKIPYQKIYTNTKGYIYFISNIDIYTAALYLDKGYNWIYRILKEDPQWQLESQSEFVHP